MIVAQYSSESLAPSDWVVKFANVGNGLQQPVSKPLMISLAVVMGHVLRNRVPKRCLSEEDHPIQTLFLDGTDKSFGERVEIRCSWRQANDIDALADERISNCVGVFRVSVVEREQGWANSAPRYELPVIAITADRSR
jgi:hypothetical protein